MSTQERGMTERGTVKWFNDAKGFGFIVHESSGKDVFVHFSVIQSEGFRTLKDGELVEYELIEGPKGLNATKVIRVNPPTKAGIAPAPVSLSSQVEIIKTDSARPNETSIAEIQTELAVSLTPAFDKPELR